MSMILCVSVFVRVCVWGFSFLIFVSKLDSTRLLPVSFGYYFFSYYFSVSYQMQFNFDGGTSELKPLLLLLLVNLYV